MQKLTVLIVVALAVWQALEIWRHSELCAAAYRWASSGNGGIRRLLSCPFCLSNWLGMAVSAALLPVDLPLNEFVIWSAALGLAGARLANLGNDLTYAWSRTPKADKFIATDEQGENS